MRPIRNLIIVFIGIAMFSCKNSNENTPLPSLGIPENVYISGMSYAKNGSTLAVFWNSGKMFVLSDSTQHAAATSIKVAGEDIYICGYDGPVAKYWKNGIGYALTDGKNESKALDIEILNNEVYIVGNKSYKDSMGITKTIPLFWKNNISLKVDHHYDDCTIDAITTDEVNIYFAGYDGFKAVYWKNGNQFQLTDGQLFSRVFAIDLKDNIPYFAGFAGSNENLCNPVYWVNEQANKVEDEQGMATDIVISDNDIYIAGSTINTKQITYWKNNNLIQIPLAASESATTIAETSKICVTGNDVHLIGRTDSKSFYCKNNDCVYLGKDQTTSSISVK